MSVTNLKTKNSYLLLVTAIVFWLLNMFLHLEFSFWITKPYDTVLGKIVLRDYFPTIALVIIVAVLWHQIFRARRSCSIWSTVFSWIILLLCSLAAAGFLLTTTIEVIHYFQYAAIGILFCLALDSEKQRWPLISISLLVCGLGIVDEVNQYMGLAASYGKYMDFNDFLLNQLGAMMGILLFYGFTPGSSLHQNYSSSVVGSEAGLLKIILFIYGGFALLLGLLRVSGSLQIKAHASIPPGGYLTDGDKLIFYLEREPGLLGSWQNSFSGEPYYVLGVFGGLGTLIGATGLVVLYKYLMLSGGKSWFKPGPD